MRKHVVVLTEALILASLTLLAACHHKAHAVPVTQAPEAPPPAPGPPTCSLTAEPAAITQGNSVTLTWTTKDATSLEIAPDIGKQLAQGSTTASPDSSTTYILTTTGPGGSATCTARVTVSVPAPPSPSVSEENVNVVGEWTAQLKDAFFDYDSANLRSDAQAVLTADAGILKAHPGAHFTVEGYCDQRGSEEYNLGLGQRRATAARDFLVNLGVAAGSLSSVSYGKDRLVCTETSEDCWQRNRRVHLRSGEGSPTP